MFHFCLRRQQSPPPLNNRSRLRCEPLEDRAVPTYLPVAPDGYADDMAMCLALRPTGDAEVVAAALRLARGLLAFLRARKPDVDSQPDLARYLADGTLQRHLDG